MKKLILSFITIIGITNLHSQNQPIGYPNVVPMSPNAAELAKYTDFPVSYYTGVPNINIPIYEINVDGINLPINLSYHASGIKSDQEATWVGLGWSLNTGGRISRSANGTDDFLLGGVDPNYPSVIKGYYYADEISTYAATHFDHPLWLDGYDTTNLIQDPEPDVFFYNLPGLSGKFILDKSRGAVLFDKSHNIKVEYSVYTGFKITDAEGNQYLYNQVEITKNYSAIGYLNKNYALSYKADEDVSRFENTAYPMISSWCLSKITTKNGREINFTYEAETQILPVQESCENYTYRGYTAVCYYKSKVVNNALRLKTISGEDFGRIEFTCSPREDIKSDSQQSKKLDAIAIYDNKNTLLKSYKFDYSYFGYSANPQYKHVFERLKLNKLTEYSGTTPLNNGYSFDYNEGDFIAKNSKNVDYWGFQNGSYYGENYYVGLTLGGVNYPGVRKDANFNKAIIGTLKKINYPSGGTTEFKFESNIISASFGSTVYEPLTAANSDYTVDLPVYNNYSHILPASYVEEADLPPSSEVYRFTIETPTTLKITGSLENQTVYKDPAYSYNDMNNPLGQLKRISPNPATICTYSCPHVYEHSYPNATQGTGPEASLNDYLSQSPLEPGIYEFTAYVPPKDVFTYWRLLYKQPLHPGTPIDAKQGGGIRISEIKTDAKTRKFKYPAEGVMMVHPFLYHNIHRTIGPEVAESSAPPLTQTSESKTPLSTFNNGNFVGYDWVEEYALDDEGNTSTIRHSFYNDEESEFFNDTYTDSPRYINYTNGLTRSIEKFTTKYGTTIPKLLEKDDFEYTSTISSTIYAFKDKGKPGNADWINNRTLLQYYYIIEWPLKTKETTTETTDAGNMVTETNYVYNTKDLLESTSTKQSTAFSLNDPQLIEKVQYPFDFPTDPIYAAMVAKNMIATPVTKETFRKDNSVTQKLTSQKTIYDNNWGNGLIAPKTVQTAKGNDTLEDRLKYNRYDAKGNLLEVEQPTGMKVSYIWGYKYTQPVAKLDNIAYTDIPTSLITAIQTATDSTTATEADVLTALTALRNSTDTNMLKAAITTLTYKPLIGVSTVTDPKGSIQYYNYDAFGRLQNVKDQNNKILSENEYHYKN